MHISQFRHLYHQLRKNRYLNMRQLIFLPFSVFSLFSSILPCIYHLQGRIYPYVCEVGEAELVYIIGEAERRHLLVLQCEAVVLLRTPCCSFSPRSAPPSRPLRCSSSAPSRRLRQRAFLSGVVARGSGDEDRGVPADASR